MFPTVSGIGERAGDKSLEFGFPGLMQLNFNDEEILCPPLLPPLPAGFLHFETEREPGLMKVKAHLVMSERNKAQFLLGSSC